MNKEKIRERIKEVLYGISMIAPWIVAAIYILRGRMDLAIIILLAVIYVKVA